jgi:hypothetical protein
MLGACDALRLLDGRALERSAPLDEGTPMIAQWGRASALQPGFRPAWQRVMWGPE